MPELSEAHQRALPLLTVDTPSTEAPGYLDLLTEPPAPPGNRAQALWFGRLGSGFYAKAQPMAARMANLHGDAQRELDLAHGETVLDLGCGPGGITRQLAESVGESGLVAAVDLSAEMLGRAVRDAPAPNIAYFRGDATRLPFRDGSFDAVCCWAMLQLLEDPFAAVDEMTRLLAPGGRIAIFTTVRRGGVRSPLTELVRGASGVRMFETGEIPAALEQRGYRDVRQRSAALVFQITVARAGR